VSRGAQRDFLPERCRAVGTAGAPTLDIDCRGALLILRVGRRASPAEEATPPAEPARLEDAGRVEMNPVDDDEPIVLWKLDDESGERVRCDLRRLRSSTGLIDRLTAVLCADQQSAHHSRGQHRWTQVTEERPTTRDGECEPVSRPSASETRVAAESA